MLPSLKFKTILLAALAFFTLACNNDPKKVKVEEVNIQTIEEDNFREPPPPPPPPPPRPKDSIWASIDIKNSVTKCYVNEGLKYKISVTLSFNKSEALGLVTSEELESGKKTSTGFKGRRKGDEFTVVFIRGEPPAIGTASKWISTPWIIKRINGKDVLEIKFNVKNYDNNRWENTPYEFELTDCK